MATHDARELFERLADPKAGNLPDPRDPNTVWVDLLRGMTLRDWFAGQVLSGLAANGQSVWINGVEFPHEKAAYLMADAMLKEREQ